MSDLAPCPYEDCEGRPELQHHCNVKYVECRSCGTQGGIFWTDVEAVYDWNTRQPPPATDDLVEAAARALAPFVCKPVYNGDCDDVAAGQNHARHVAKQVLSAVTPIIEARAKDEAYKKAAKVAIHAFNESSHTAGQYPYHDVQAQKYRARADEASIIAETIRALKGPQP